ncbi:MAG: hypothetical protein V3V81_07990 [Candidatus Bathyarchaeia archaeon]
MSKKKSFEDIAKDEMGTIYYDKFDEGVRFIVMRGPVSLCGYVGIPAKHPLAGHNYDDLPIEAHGGLTFSQRGKGGEDHWPRGYWWYGWDYAHSGDYAFYDLKDPSWKTDEKKWVVKEVIDDSWDALYGFKKLMRLAEEIYNKSRKTPLSKKDIKKIAEKKSGNK